MASSSGPVYPVGPRPDAPVKMRICGCHGCFRAIPDGDRFCVPCTDRVNENGTVVQAWHGPAGQHGYGGDLEPLPAEIPPPLVEAITLINQCVGGYDLSEAAWEPSAELPVKVLALRALRTASRFLYPLTR